MISVDRDASLSDSKFCTTSEDNVIVEDDDPIENWRGLGKPKTSSVKTVKSRRSQFSIMEPQVIMKIMFFRRKIE